jgi:hypothetical protein
MAFSRNSFRLTCLAAVGAVFLLAFGASNAFASCSYSTEGKTFSQWNDPSYYVPAPNGGFEGGTVGWTLSGASLVSGNESFFLGGSSDTSSLSFRSGGSATSAAFCVDQGFPTFRFMTRSTSGFGALLRVDVIYLDNGTTGTIGYVTAGSAWAPARTVALAIGRTSSGGIAASQVQLRFTAVEGSFQIDDLYIDPWARY